MDELKELRLAFESHVLWDNAEHQAMRKEHETDNRVLIQAINDLRITVEKSTNKIIMMVCGSMGSVVVGTIIWILPHIH